VWPAQHHTLRLCDSVYFVTGDTVCHQPTYQCAVCKHRTQRLQEEPSASACHFPDFPEFPPRELFLRDACTAAALFKSGALVMQVVSSFELNFKQHSNADFLQLLLRSRCQVQSRLRCLLGTDLHVLLPPRGREARPIQQLPLRHSQPVLQQVLPQPLESKERASP